jgi:alanine racemase
MWRATVRINLDAIKHNYLYAKSLAPQSKTVAVIKANGYGHGAIPIAKVLEHGNDVDALAVANVSEGVKLREGGVQHPHLMILQGPQGPSQWEEVFSHNLIPMIHNPDQMDYCLNNWPSTRSIWVKIDTGMHRLGISPASAESFLRQCLQKFGKDRLVVCSHFACSDEVGLDFNKDQLKILTEIRQKLDLSWSIANSGAIMTLPQAHGTWNRAGFMLYGNSPLATDHPSAKDLKPAMHFSAPIIAIREVSPGESVGYSRKWYATQLSRIATVAVGYADGYPRHAPNGTPVLIRNQRAPLAGRVSMDMITVDITDVPDARIGDEVCLWGEGLSVNEVAAAADTIGYELLTKVTTRPKKEYVTSVQLL